MTLAEKLNRLILNLGDKKTDNTLQGTPLTGEDTRLLKDVLAGMYDLIINSGGGGSGIQSVTGTNVDNTAALGGGLVTGDLYQTAGIVKIVI